MGRSYCNKALVEVIRVKSDKLTGVRLGKQDVMKNKSLAGSPGQ